MRSLSFKYDLNHFIRISGLSPADAADIFGDLSAELLRLADEISEHYRNKNWECLLSSLHALKGLALNFRMTAVYGKTNYLYGLIRNGERDSTELSLSSLLSSIQNTIHDINDTLQSEFVLEKAPTP